MSRRQTQNASLGIGLIVLVAIAFWGLRPVAQVQAQTGGMPDGWESLAADEFATAAAAYLSQSPAPEGELPQQVVQHAWDRLLADDAALDSLSLAEVQQLNALVRPRQEWLLGDNWITDVEQKAATDTQLVDVGDRIRQ
ncbi:MAG: hypothetical protein AB7U20_11635 [Planctomycetaceae bacterium]